MLECSVIFPLENQLVVYENLALEYLSETVDCVSRVFSEQEPLACKLGVTAEDMEPIAFGFSRCALKEGNGVIARDRASGKVVGFAISHDFLCDPMEEVHSVAPSLSPIMALLGDLYEVYNRQPLEKGEVYYFNIGGVDHGYYRGLPGSAGVSGNQVAAQLFEANLAIARQKRYKKCVAMATSFFSQSLLRNAGFEEVHRVDYEGFEFEGSKPFKGMAWHLNCQLLEKDL